MKSQEDTKEPVKAGPISALSHYEESDEEEEKEQELGKEQEEREESKEEIKEVEEKEEVEVKKGGFPNLVGFLPAVVAPPQIYEEEDSEEKKRREEEGEREKRKKEEEERRRQEETTKLRDKLAAKAREKMVQVGKQPGISTMALICPTILYVLGKTP